MGRNLPTILAGLVALFWSLAHHDKPDLIRHRRRQPS